MELGLIHLWKHTVMLSMDKDIVYRNPNYPNLQDGEDESTNGWPSGDEAQIPWILRTKRCSTLDLEQDCIFHWSQIASQPGCTGRDFAPLNDRPKVTHYSQPRWQVLCISSRSLPQGFFRTSSLAGRSDPANLTVTTKEHLPVG